MAWFVVQNLTGMSHRVVNGHRFKNGRKKKRGGKSYINIGFLSLLCWGGSNVVCCYLPFSNARGSAFWEITRLGDSLDFSKKKLVSRTDQFKRLLQYFMYLLFTNLLFQENTVLERQSHFYPDRFLVSL